RSESTERTGDGFVKWGLIAFIGLWALFELFIFGGNNWLITTIMPLALIGFGLYLLVRGRSSEKTKVVYSGNGHRKSKSDRLQEEIDAALAEDDNETV
ncbi:MAG TPA: hypothetical protein VKY59_07390, partial [Spirillospora sp.]|nr:hypothetical protein [Spirillospora sp.]